MMIRASPSEKLTSGKAVVQLGRVDDKPVVVIGKGSSVVAKKPEPVKVVLQGVPSATVLVVKAARVKPAIIRPVMQLLITIDDDRIHKNSVCIRGFDGGGIDAVGDIILELTVGPVEFTMEFQVIDVAVSYNLLLGQPWIHEAKAVPSTLHQMVKFEWDRQEIVVHGDDGTHAVSDAIVPFIETDDDKGPWVYQSYDDMPGLSMDLVVHKLPTDLVCPPVKQKLRKFKTDMSVKIKEEVTKQMQAKVIRVTRYPDWLANVVSVPKKDGKIRIAMLGIIRF
ncbi:uncharacterized protein [Nicotiana sylvestris]|uniref:uncharacterized protein n=1 Tax=Nicotiana sylvestris TaxID=4096 RepID=UPI00388CCFEA